MINCARDTSVDVWNRIPHRGPNARRIILVSTFLGGLAVVPPVYDFYRYWRGTDNASRVVALITNLKNELPASLKSDDLEAAVKALVDDGNKEALEALDEENPKEADAILASKIAKLKRIREVTANEEAALYRQRGTLASINDIPSAVQFYSKAVELNEDDPYSWEKLGILQTQARGYTDALTSFQRLLVLSEQLKQPHWKATAYNSLGITYTELKDYDAAETAYKNAKGVYEKFPEGDGIAIAEGNLGQLYSKQEKLADAEKATLSAVKFFENYPPGEHLMSYLTNLGIIYDQQKKNSEACVQWRRALNIAETINYIAVVSILEKRIESKCPK